MLNRNVIKFVLVILLLTNGLVYAADTPKVTSEFDVKQDESLTEQEWNAISHAAAYVVIHTHQARTAIHKNHYDVALEEVKEALNLIGIIENTMPDYTIHSKIVTNGKTQENQYTLHPLVVNIFDEFGDFSVLESVKREKTKKAQKNGNAKTEERISEFGNYDITATLDTTLARADLENAKQSLELKETNEADTWLSRLQGDAVNLEIDTTDIEMDKK